MAPPVHTAGGAVLGSQKPLKQPTIERERTMSSSIPVTELVVGDTVMVPVRTMGIIADMPRVITAISNHGSTVTLHYRGGRVVALSHISIETEQ